MVTIARAPDHQDARDEFPAFVEEHVIPYAGEWDRRQRLPDRLVEALGRARYIVATVPREAGGLGMDMTTYAALAEEIGRGCGSVRNFIGVQGMVAHAILKWGTADQAKRWVEPIATGHLIAAFALTEPEVGSDARALTMTAERVGGGYRLTGRKKWISFGQCAGLYLTFARLDGDVAAFLVERETPGLTVTPLTDLLGLRASALAELSFDGAAITGEALLTRGPLTFDAVATTALDYGRHSTACGCVGLAESCLRASLTYARERTQFGVPIAEHQLVRRLLTDMIARTEAARLLCRRAGASRDARHADAIRQTLVAKYFASTAAVQVAGDAVQLHGASGCGPGHPVERHWRDAKVQEIIEGTSQIQQLQIAQLTLQRHGTRAHTGTDRSAAEAGPG